MIRFDIAVQQRLSLVPLLPDTKRPYWKEWQQTPALIEHESPEVAWKEATSTGEAGIVPRMSGLIAFESDTLERRNELLRFLAAGYVEPCYVEMRRGNAAKLHVYAREPYVLDSDEDCAYFFDEGGLTAKRTAQMRCALSPSSDYATVLERWDAPRITPHGYAWLVERASKIEAAQARKLRESSGTAHDAGSRHTAVFRLGCLLFRFTADPEAVEAAAWRWQSEKFGEGALSDRREVARQLRGSLRKVEDAGEVAVELKRRNSTARAVEDTRRHLSACLFSTWTDDADLIADVAAEVVPRV